MSKPRLTLLGRLAYRDITRGLEPPTHPDVVVERDLAVGMRDGVALLTDVWAPRGDDSGQIVLLRTPYGRRNTDFLALVLAERGHRVVVQSCRGTFGSGGEFVPFVHEASDGADCLAWIAEQPWAGPVHTYGYSYYGFTQWALVDAAPAALVGMTVGVSAREASAVVLPSGGFGHETLAAWLGALRWQEHRLPRLVWVQLRARATLAKAAAVPLRHVDRLVVGRRVQWYQSWLDHPDPADPWWAPARWAQRLDCTPPVNLVAGWYDPFIVDQVADFVALRVAGRPAALVVGPWTHMDGEIGRQCLGLLLDQLAGRPQQALVRVKVTGENGWRTADAWPPSADERTWWWDGQSLREGPQRNLPSGLAEQTWTYDPLDPTPSCGGRTLSPTSAGPRDQREREERADVPYATSEVLTHDLVVLGEPVFEGWFSSTALVADLFVRLCDVDPSGRSIGVCEGYLRQRGDGEVRLVLAPIGHRFAAGHRLRLQVSSGAHPWYARQTGTESISDEQVTPSTQRLAPGARLVLPVAASERPVSPPSA